MSRISRPSCRTIHFWIIILSIFARIGVYQMRTTPSIGVCAFTWIPPSTLSVTNKNSKWSTGQATRQAFTRHDYYVSQSSSCGVVLHSMIPTNIDGDDDVVIRLGLDENFDRWRFMQNLLDYEIDSSDANQVLYKVLDGYLKYPRPLFRNNDDDSLLTGSPPLTDRNRPILEALLSAKDDDNDDGHDNHDNTTPTIPALTEPECSPGKTQVLQQLQQLLPDPQEEEDEHKGTWDTIMELHGRESTKVNEMKQTPQWVATCLVARVLIYYDFLTLGVVNKPIDV